MSNFCEIEKLVELFNDIIPPNQLDDEKDGENPKASGSDMQCLSNDAQTNKTKTKKESPYNKVEPPERKEVLDPEQEFDLYFDQNEEGGSSKSWKKTPKWDISYRQSVTASDVFLGMGFKNPSTSSCENMVVAIHLPGEQRQNMDLKIEPLKLVLVSPRFYLDLDLPHPVDPKLGNAQFDSGEEKLIVTLVMQRELDLVNF